MPENFEIANLWVFYLLPLPILIYWLLPSMRIRSSYLEIPGFDKAVNYTAERPRKGALVKRRGWVQMIVLFLSWILILMALSSPQLVGEPELRVKTSRNFLIAADISFSMAQKDWMSEGERVRRWDAVKEVLHGLIDSREGDRMGLLFFGTNAYVQAPFTSDLKTVDELLEEADVGMAGQMTHVGKAITKGATLFEEDTIETKVMLLLTDGVDSGTDILPLDAAELAMKDSIQIYTIGIGVPGNAGSDLDEKTLTQIAEMTDGQYFLARDKEMLEQINEELNKLEPIEFEEKENRPVELLYPYPLGVSIALLLLSSLLSSLIQLVMTVKRKENTYA